MISQVAVWLAITVLGISTIIFAWICRNAFMLMNKILEENQKLKEKLMGLIENGTDSN